MPYVGGSLTKLFDPEARAIVGESCRSMAADGADRLHELIVENTPIHHGNLRSSWYELVVKRRPGPTGFEYETGVASDVDYAPHVEYGTGTFGPSGAPYEIRPKTPGGFLAWKDPRTGRWIYARKVMHPGSPGQHMVAIGCGALEMEIDGGLLDRQLRQLARNVEVHAANQPGGFAT